METLERSGRHLGAYVEQLALSALPRSYKGEEENADSNEAAAMTHSDSHSRHLPTKAIFWTKFSGGGATADSLIPKVSTNFAPDFACAQIIAYCRK